MWEAKLQRVCHRRDWRMLLSPKLWLLFARPSWDRLDRKAGHQRWLSKIIGGSSSSSSDALVTLFIMVIVKYEHSYDSRAQSSNWKTAKQITVLFSKWSSKCSITLLGTSMLWVFRRWNDGVIWESILVRRGGVVWLSCISQSDYLRYMWSGECYEHNIANTMILDNCWLEK